jgi:hypothetical protein
MTEPRAMESSIPPARKRALIIPREHGAWGLLLVPLFSGIAAGVRSAQRIWLSVVFTVAALSLFWLRTPVESLLGTSPLTAQGPNERKLALKAAVLLAVVFGACLAALLWEGQNLKLLLIGAVATVAFLLQNILRRLGRGTRMASQVAGAFGLTAAAPAAYYIASGRLDGRALALWLANCLFAGNQIHFVQLRIHAARAAGFSERFSQARTFFVAQALLLPVLGAAAFFHLVPFLLPLAFAPVVVRGTVWFFQKPKPLNLKSVGWSEMRQGVIFGILVAMAFILS